MLPRRSCRGFEGGIKNSMKHIDMSEMLRRGTFTVTK